MKSAPIGALSISSGLRRDFGFGDFGLGLDAAGANFDALAIVHGVLEIRQQAADGSPHAVGPLDSAGIGFAA